MADSSAKKRKASSDTRRDGDNKRSKGKKQWNTPRRPGAEARNIQPGDAGIWATCAMKKEAKSVPDLRDLFQQYAEKLYNEVDGGVQEPASEDEEEDIEAAINKEIADIRKPSKNALFTSVKLNTQCLVFFKTRAPVETVSFVEKICQDAAAGVKFHNCRYVKRLTPITACEKATSKGLDAVAKTVLAPHFHEPGQKSLKFAIRPTIRNNKEFTRDEVIRTIAAAVGPGHKVDLHNYDLLIIVEIYQNIIGMSVVGPDFEKFKRYNIEELRQIASPEGVESKKAESRESIPIVQEG